METIYKHLSHSVDAAEFKSHTPYLQDGVMHCNVCGIGCEMFKPDPNEVIWDDEGPWSTEEEFCEDQTRGHVKYVHMHENFCKKTRAQRRKKNRLAKAARRKTR